MLTQADLAPDPLQPTAAEVERYVKGLQEREDDLARREADEPVEVVPGAYLGKVLLRRGRDRHWALMGYFRLQPAG